MTYTYNNIKYKVIYQICDSYYTKNGIGCDVWLIHPNNPDEMLFLKDLPIKNQKELVDLVKGDV